MKVALYISSLLRYLFLDENSPSRNSQRHETTHFSQPKVLFYIEMSQTTPPSIGFPDDELLFHDLSRHSNVSTTIDLDNEPITHHEVATSSSLLPVSTKIRHAVLQAVQDVQWANDVQQSYRELKRSQRKVIRSKLLMGTSLGLEMSERCVLCTLPLGTCEHYKPVYQHHHHQGTTGGPPQRSIMKRQYQPPQKHQKQKQQQQQPSHDKTAATKGSGTEETEFTLLSSSHLLSFTVLTLTHSLTHTPFFTHPLPL